MPYTQDYSDYFTITGLPETITRSISQSLSVSESLGVSVSTWKTVISVAVSLSLVDSGLSKTVTDFRSNYTNSDSLTLTDSGLSRSTDTWRHIFSVSAGLGLTDSGLTKTASTWRYGITPSDSLGLTDSGLSKAIATWRHIINYNMSLTISESLLKATAEWRKQLTKTDSISVSDGLDVDVETIIHIRDLSDSLSGAESLGLAIQLWYNQFTVSDSLSISDSLNVQLAIPKNTYFYDNIGLSDSTPVVGYVDNGAFTGSNGVVTNVSSLTDGETSSPATFSSSDYAGVRFDLGSQKETNFICIHLQGGINDSIKLYGSNSQGSGYSLIISANSGNANWTVNEYNSVSYRYYALQLEDSVVNSKIDEIIIGKSFTPEVRHSIGSIDGLKNTAKINESFSGSEYSHKTADEEKTIVRSYNNISATLKTSLNDIWLKSNNKKLIYSYTTVDIIYANVEPISFNEIAFNRYSSTVTLSE